MLRPVQADFRELPAHPATTSEFKQFVFFDLTGTFTLNMQERIPLEKAASAAATLRIFRLR